MKKQKRMTNSIQQKSKMLCIWCHCGGCLRIGKRRDEKKKQSLPLNRLVGGPSIADFLFQEGEWAGGTTTSSWRRRGGRRKEKYARTRRDRIERTMPAVYTNLRRL